MNLFLFCVMFFIKKGSFPAKTAVNTFNAVSTCTESVHIFQILYTRQFFCRFLSHAFTLCVHGRDNIEGNNKAKQVIIKQKHKNINKIDIFKLV